jgi:hypothetical protein
MLQIFWLFPKCEWLDFVLRLIQVAKILTAVGSVKDRNLVGSICSGPYVLTFC